MPTEPFYLITLMKKHPELTALALVILGAFLPGWLSLIQNKLADYSFKEQLDSPTSWPSLAKRYSGSGWSGYNRAIEHLLAATSRIYGDKPLGKKAYSRSLQIAFIYPPLCLLIGWVVFGVGSIGGLEILPVANPETGEAWLWHDRTWRALTLVALMVFMFFSYEFAELLASWIEAKLTKPREALANRAGFLPKAARMALASLPTLAFLAAYFAAFAGAFAGAVAAAFAGAVAVAVTFTFAFAGAFAGAVAFAVAAAFAGAVAVAVAVGAAFAGEANEASIYLLFFAILPLLNSFADFLSLAATRSFLGDIQRHEHALLRILLDVLLDIIIAALCLVFLLGSTWAALTAWEAIAPSTLAFDYRAYVQALLKGDYRQASLLIMLVSTTLLPTVIHILTGITGIFAVRSNSWAKAAKMLSNPPAAPDVAYNQDILTHLRRGQYWAWVKTTLCFVVLPYATVLVLT
ncbi:hypothetical protein KO498_10350 [Lentibacter algarum]|uniref:hypothetical protein n=1 Tax=Lentibacter algarum TaxID=576131 RepID=UPI001C06BD5E|nr:hypothetical protein [Lentibacter algarum]MBU2982207.1 hypothetical protein [Lentibacter algarum]